MGLLDLFGGDATQPGALYGGLLSPQQNSALGYRGLLAAAGALGQAAMPSRLPIPIGAALGQAAGAMGSAQDEAALNAMRGQLVGLQGQSLASDLAIRKQLAGLLPGLAGAGGTGASPIGGGEVGSPAPNANISAPGGNDYAGTGNDFLKNQRQRMADEITNTPGLQDQVLAMASLEDDKDPAGPIEALFNRAAYTGKSLSELLHNGFYGPINRGQLPSAIATLNSSDVPGVRSKMQAGLDAVIAGSNRLQGATDQGMAGDPNANTTSGLIMPKGGTPGAIYNDWGGGPGGVQGAAAWRLQQQAKVGGKPTQLAQANTGTVTDAVPAVGEPSIPALPTPGTVPGPAMPSGAAQFRGGLPPGVKFNSQGVPYNPAMVGTNGVPSGIGIPAAPSAAASAPQGLLPPQAPGSDTLRVGGAGGLLAPPQPTATPFTNAPPINGIGAPAPGPQSGMLTPQAPQMAQAAPRPPMPSGAPGMGIGLPPVPNIDPRSLAAASSLAQLGHMGDVFGPLEKFYYQSPGYLAQAGQAKALGEGAGQLPYAGPLAAAKAAATFPYEFQLGRSKFLEGRPGAGFYDPVTQKEIFQVPTLQQTVNPDQSKSFTYVQPGLNGGAPTLQPTGAQSELAPAPHAQATESGKLGAEFGGLPGAQPGTTATPPAAPAPQSNKPVPTPQGTQLPPLTEQFMPQSAAELEHAVPAWQKKTDDWNAGIAPARQAEMRLGTIAQAFKLTETGAFETHKAELATALKSLGIDPGLVMQTNPAAVQMALHDNILTTLPLLKAATPRPSQIEFMSVSENREHPNLQPTANLRMLTEDLALVRQAQQLPADWNAAQQQGWRNPQSFETAWSRLNPLDATRDQVEKEIGPLKGMPGNTTPKQTAPEGTIINGPNGQRLQNRGGQWFDLQTLKPYSSGQ